MGFWWSHLARLLRQEPPRDKHAELLILQLRMLQALGRIEREMERTEQRTADRISKEKER